MSRIDDLRAEAEAEEAAAKEEAITSAEADEAALVMRTTMARESRALSGKTRRAITLATREKAARAARTDKRAIIGGLDLVGLFPVGNAPDPSEMPGGGVLILRSPMPERCTAFHTETEAKARPLADISADLACESTVEPDVAKDPIEGAKLRAFLEAYPNVAIAAGSKALVLGGSRSASDKRGHG